MIMGSFVTTGAMAHTPGSVAARCRADDEPPCRAMAQAERPPWSQTPRHRQGERGSRP
jgi:hypothetical protein